MARMQGETLDNLKEGVAVFGSDGRLRLHNPAFAAIWKLSMPIMNETAGRMVMNVPFGPVVVEIAMPMSMPLELTTRSA